MIIFDATDKRFQGEQSMFFKSLRAFSQLDLVDTKNPNVVVVMTHVCSVPYKKWKSELKQKADSIKRLIQQALRVEPPVVCIENDYEEWGLKTTKRGYQSKLPDGINQPNNLFLAIANQLREIEDNLGLQTFKHFYKTSEQKKNVHEYTSSRAKTAKEQQLNSEETKLLNALMDEGKGGGQLPETITKAKEFVSTKGSALTKV